MGTISHLMQLTCTSSISYLCCSTPIIQKWSICNVYRISQDIPRLEATIEGLQMLLQEKDERINELKREAETLGVFAHYFKSLEYKRLEANTEEREIVSRPKKRGQPGNPEGPRQWRERKRLSGRFARIAEKCLILTTIKKKHAPISAGLPIPEGKQ